MYKKLKNIMFKRPNDFLVITIEFLIVPISFRNHRIKFEMDRIKLTFLNQG